MFGKPLVLDRKHERGPGCPRVYVATKNQRRCREHQAEARRRVQRAALLAFRKRARQKRMKQRRKKTRTRS